MTVGHGGVIGTRAVAAAVLAVSMALPAAATARPARTAPGGAASTAGAAVTLVHGRPETPRPSRQQPVALPLLPSALSPNQQAHGETEPYRSWAGATDPPTTWRIQRSVNRPVTADGFNGVACPSARNCVAVGSALRADPVSNPTAAVWRGRVWQRTTVPNPQPSGALGAISCVSASRCTAVGWSTAGITRDFTLVDFFNGRRWVVQRTPRPSDERTTQFESVSCPASAFCVAVGMTQTYANDTYPVIGTWHGTSWRLTELTNVGSHGGELGSVSCTSSTSCMAVGRYWDSDTPLAEAWDGHGWKASAPPTPAPTDGNEPLAELNGVQCPAARSCFAVGEDLNSDQPPLIEHWDGTAWTIANVPGSERIFYAISCPGRKYCLVTGESTTNSAPVTYEMSPSGWSQVTAPAPPRKNVETLHAVACSAASECTVVGSTSPSTRLPHRTTAVERLSGRTWTDQRSPNVQGSVESGLDAVSCTSSRACMAVGQGDYISDAYPLVAEQWNGNRWVVHVPKTPPDVKHSEPADLAGVSCAGPSACTTVGTYVDKNEYVRVLIERWNGRRWSLERGAAKSYGSLNAVSCPAVRSCIAVGSFGGVPLSERWNGKRWSVITTVTKGAAALAGISCPTARRCTAVGGTVADPADGTRMLIENWTGGKQWKLAAAPTPSAGANAAADLASIDCYSASNCTAVGGQQAGSAPERTLAIHWTGTAWVSQQTPNPTSTRGTALTAVACARRSSCQAVGADVTGSSSGRPFAAARSGSTWRTVPVSTPPRSMASGLFGVVCPARCVAVGGNRTDLGANVTLVERTGKPKP